MNESILEDKLKNQDKTIKYLAISIIGLFMVIVFMAVLAVHDINTSFTRDEIFSVVSENNDIPELVYNSTTKFYTSVDGNHTYLAYDLDNNITVFRLEHAEYIKIGSKYIYAGKNQTEILHIPIETKFEFK